MALSTWTYSTDISDVQVRIGDLSVNARVFSSTTVPTKIQVEELVNQSAAEINMTLEHNRYTAPVSSASDPFAFKLLKAAQADGAAARILATLPAEAFAMNATEEEARGRGSYYQQQFNHVLKLIRDGVFEAARSRSLQKGIMVGSAETRAGVEKEPFFQKYQWDFPGTRQQTETST